MVFKWCSLAGLVFGLVGGVLLYRAYQEHIVDNPGSHIDFDYIQSIIFQESPVYYSDGETPLGVLYAEEHREYVSFEDLPEPWIDAITAAEDQRFFDHPGVDAMGISRAMWQNFRAGKVVAGGSTITQQTAKNLYYRPDRSWGSKWTELLDALRLEAHFSKEQILEFYANQFHVSSNGRGIGIAARYFFDKEVDELSVLECAYIAGMVKSPSTYNPFIGRSRESRERARSKARKRTRYVLDRMLESGSLGSDEHASLIEQEIPFQRGTFKYHSNVLVDEVSRRLDLAPFPQLFAELGIDNISTAGIQVRTTVQPEPQREALYSLWHHLSEVGPMLEGQTAADLILSEEKAPVEDPFAIPELHQFRSGRVVATDAKGLDLDLGGHRCRVDEAAIQRTAEILVRAEAGEKWRKATAEHQRALIEALPPGTILWVSLRNWDEEQKLGTCDLELRPELQGAVVLIEDGLIRAMVGGNDNQNFNRALAPRQLGSTWKPLIYQAALEAGWSPADRLDNREHAFYFETSWYYPRAAHRGEPFVSMSWAGTRSENLASIWLLAHLTDRMSNQTFQQEAIRLGLAPELGDQVDSEWVKRIRDDLGVLSTDRWIPELAFNAARLERLEQRTLGWEEHLEVQSLFYGDFGGNYDRERGRANSGARSRSGKRKIWALDSNFRRFQEHGEACRVRVAELADQLPDLEAEEDPMRITPILGPGGVILPSLPLDLPDPAQFEGLVIQKDPAGSTRIACGEASTAWAAIDRAFLDDFISGRVELAPDETSESDELELDFWIDGRIRWSTIRGLETLASWHEILLEEAGGYDFERLQYHPDYRTQVAMHYVADLAAELGVKTRIPLFLSMPLGAADISLLEMVGVYEGLTGRSRSDAFQDQQILIAEILDRNGQVLYRAEGASTVASDRRVESGRLTGDILRNVVKWGTGRRAREAVTIGEHVVPVAGKTGTTNNYKNAAFLGFIPKETGGEWRWGEGYSLGVYVGYDDNREMVRGGVKLEGALGALPAWIGTAQGLASAGLLGDGNPVSSEWVIGTDSGLTRVSALDKSGLPEVGGSQFSEGQKFDPSPSVRSILLGSADLKWLEPESDLMQDGAAEAFDEETPVRIEVDGGGTALPALP